MENSLIVNIPYWAKAPCLLFAALLLCAGLLAAPQTVVLKKGDIKIDKDKQIEVLVDKSAVTNGERNGISWAVGKKFQPYGTLKEKLQKGELLSEYTYWAKYRFRAQDAGTYYFHFGVAENIRVYELGKDGRLKSRQEAGKFTPRSELKVQTNYQSAKLYFAKGEEKTIYVRFINKTRVLPLIKLVAQDADTFQQKWIFERVGFQALFQAAIWMMIFYTLLLWIAVRDRAHLFYALYMFVISATFFLDDQLHFIALKWLAEYPELVSILKDAGPHIAIVMYFLFMQKMLNTKRIVPLWHKVTIFWIILKVLTTPLLIYYNTYVVTGNVLPQAVMALDFIVLFACCIALLFKKDKVAVYFAIGSIALALGGLFTVLEWNGLFNGTFLDFMRDETYIQAGILAQILIFSLGLGYKSRYNASLVFELQQQNEDLVQRLRAKVNEQEKTLRLFMRYVPEPVVAKALNKGDDSVFDGELRYVAALFCDVRGFTTISEELKPREVVAFLNDFYAVMTVIIKKYGGSVNQFIGDEIFAVFGAPLSTSNNEQRAVLAALEMVEKVRSLNEKYQPQFKRPIHVGIGINAGEVVAGNLGSEEKIGYSVIGDTVNTAKRLEGLTKNILNSIVVSESVYVKVAPIVQVEAIPPLFLKGKKNEMKPFRILHKK